MEETVELYNSLTLLFRDVFDDATLVLHPDLTAADVPNWDSLSHIDLIVAIERQFKIKFTTHEVASLTNVGDLVSLIQGKRTARS